MLLTAKQMVLYHKLKDEEFEICCNSIKLELVRG